MLKNPIPQNMEKRTKQKKQNSKKQSKGAPGQKVLKGVKLNPKGPQIPQDWKVKKKKKADTERQIVSKKRRMIKRRRTRGESLEKINSWVKNPTFQSRIIGYSGIFWKYKI